MVAVVSGNGLGLFNTSLTQLGLTFGGQAGIGQSRESQLVNIATGNLLLQDFDESLQVRGLNATFLRTYNSRGQVSDAGQDAWLTGFERHVALSSGTLNVAGSTMTQYTGDGQAVVFTYSSPNTYTATAGGGAHDTLVWNSGTSTWTFTEGSTQREETYANHADATLQGRLTRIRDLKSDGTTPAEFDVLYNAGNQVSEVRSIDGAADGTQDALLFTYSGTQLTSVTTREGGVVKSQLSYGYDGVGRLAWVQTDLTPTLSTDNTWDGTTAANNDGKSFRTTYSYVSSTASDLRIASVTDSDGVAVNYTYESDGTGGYRVKTVTQGSAADGSAQTVTFNYNVGSTDVVDGSGRTWTYQYDTNDQLTAVLEPAVAGQRTVTSYTYTTSADPSGAGNVTQIKAMLGSAVLSQTDRTYDANGNMLWQWTRVDGASAAATAVQRTYSATNQLLTETRYTGLDPDGPGATAPTGGLVTNYIYDAQNRLRFLVDAAGEVTERIYATTGNGVGQVASERHYLGATYAGTMTETALSSWATTTQQSNSTVSAYAYDIKGRLQQTVNYATVDGTGAGVLDVGTGITNFIYDAQGLLLQKISVHGASRTLGSVPAGSEVTEYIYDGMGRLLSALSRDSNTVATDDANTIATTYAYTDSANQIKVTLDTGAIRTEARNAAGQLLSVSDAGLVSGSMVTRTTQNFFDATGRLRATQDATGARSYFFYDSVGRLSAQVDAIGAVTSFLYDGMDRVIQTVAYATRVDTSAWLSGSTVTKDTLIYAATSPTLLAGQAWVPTDAVNDRNGMRTYDALGRLSTQTDAAGLVTTYAYDGVSNLLSITVAKPGDGTVIPRVTRFFYDSANRQIATLNTAGYLTESVFDPGGRLVMTIRYATLTNSANWTSGTLAQLRPAADATNDQVTRLFYDGRDQLVGVLNAEGDLTENVYDEQANQRAVKAYAKRLTGLTGSETLSALRTLALTSPPTEALQLTQRSFNGLGQMTTELNAEGTVTRYSYDEAGRLVTIDAADATSEVRENIRRYDVFGNLIGELDGQGSLQLSPNLTDPQLDALYAQYGTTHSYDLVGRRTESIDAQGNKTWYFYDADGRQTFLVRGVTDGNGIKNAQGEVTEMRYSAFGQVTDKLAYTGRITVAVAGSRASVLSAIGTLVFVSATDTRRQLGYDVRGLLTRLTDAESVVSNYTYTAFGQLLQEQRATATSAAVTIQHAYDQRGLETSRIDALGVTGVQHSVSQSFDAFGRAITQTDARGTVSTLTYDRLGRQIGRSEIVEGRTEAWQTSYDAFNRTLTQVDALGNTTSYAYSDTNRSVTVTTAEGVVMSTVHNRFGQTFQVTTTAGTSSYSYDHNGQLTQETDASGVVSTNIVDVRGLLTETTDATGRKVDYMYDAVGRVLSRIVDPAGLALTTTYNYDGQGRQIHTVDASGRITDTAYDREARVLSVAQDPSGLNLRTSYTWDAAGRELTVIEGAGSATSRTTAYVYDALGRRISETVDPGTGKLNLTTTYAYDADDNVVTRTDALGNLTRLAYDEANRLRFTVDAKGDVTQTQYDADGRVAMTRRYAKAANLTGVATAPSVAQLQSLISTQALTNDAVDPVDYRVYDKDGRLRFHIDGLGDVSEAQYDSASRTIGMRGYATAITIDAALKTKLLAGTALVADITAKLTVNDTRDAQSYQILDAAGRVRFTVDGMGDVTETRFDAAGRAMQQLGYITALLLSAADRTALKAGTLTVATIASRVSAQESIAHTSYQVFDGAGRVRYTVARSQVGASVVGTVSENRYDASGLVVAQIQYAPTVAFDPTQPEASLTTLLTNAQGNLPANQHITRFVYDAGGRLRFTVTDAGTVTEQRFDAAGRVTTTRNYGQTLPVPVIDYTEATLATAVAGFADTRQVSYLYDAAGRLASTTDALTQTESYGYDADGRRTSLTNKLGYVWTYVYDAAGRQTEVHSPLVSVLRFDASGNLLAPSSESVVTRIGYDALGNVTSRTEAYGTAEARTTTYEYDARGNQVRTVFPDAWTVNSSGVLVASGITPDIRITYDALDRAVVQKDVRGNYSYKVYDLQGRLAYDIDAAGYVTGYSYDALSESVQLTRYATKLNTAGISGWTAGQSIRLDQMQIAGVLVTSATQDRTLSTTFDVAGNKRVVTQSAVSYRKADGSTATGSPRTEFELDAYGQVVKESVLLEGTPGQSDAKWAYTFHYYDDLGRQVMNVDAEGYVTTWIYTAQGEVSQQTEYARAISTATLTTAARPSTPAPGDETIGYDRITQYKYDEIGRKKSETAVARHYEHTDGSSGIRDVLTTLVYDAADHVTQSTVDGVATQTVFDALGRTLSVEEAQRTILATNFDTQLSGTVSATTNLSTAALYVQSSPYTTIAYDTFGNAVQVRRYANGWVQGQGSAVTSTNDQVQTTQYDRQGRAVVERTAEATSVYRHYDAADNLTEVDYRLDGNDGRWANVRSLASYNAVNQQTLTQVFRDKYLNATSLGTVSDQVVQVKYNAFGEITSKGDDSNPNATLAAQYGYDAVGRMITTNAQGGVLRTYGYNLAGYQVIESHSVTVATGDVTATTTQVNDRLGRVTQVTLPSYTNSLTVTSTVNQTVDRWGNVIQMVDPRGYVTNTAYNQLNQKVSELQPLVKVVDDAGIESWVRPQTRWFYGAQGRLEGTQDANGNINKIVYDAAGRQIQSIDAFGNATLNAFDAFGQQRLTQDPMGYITFQSVDRLGRVTGQGDYLPNGAARNKVVLQGYTLDQNGDRITVTDALSKTSKYDFDSRSLLIRSQTPMGVVMNDAYDASGHKTLEEDGDTTHVGVESWSTDYFGRTTAHSDLSAHTYTYTYDASSGELTHETSTNGLNSSTIYYANGQVRQTQETGGPLCYYEYDAAGNRTLEETTTTDSQGLALHVRTRTYYDSHNRIQRVVQDDVVTGTRVFDLTYDYDAQGNRTRVVATSGYGTNTTAISTQNLAPVVVDTPDNRTLRVGIATSFRIRASDVFRDPELDVLTIDVKQLVSGAPQALPSWLTCTLDTSTGELVFNTTGPTASPGQNFIIQLAATDTSGNTTKTTFTVGVVTDSTPISSGVGTTAFIAKTDQSWAIEVPASDYFSDPDVGDTLTLSAGVVPPASWLTVDVSNPSVVRLSGTPTLANAGTYTITVTARDAAGASVTRTLTVLVTPNRAPTATAITAQDATINRTFDMTRNVSQVFNDLDGDALALTATLADGTALPAWLSFQYLNDQAIPQLRLTGSVPASETIARVYQVKLTATDTNGATVSTTVAITIQPNRPPLVIGSAPSLSGKTYTAFAADIPIASVFSDPDGDTLSFDLATTGYTGASGWVGLTVDYDNGLLHLSGTPQYNQVGDYSVQIRAHDADGLSATLTVNLHIADSPALAITAMPPSPTLYVGQAFSLTIPQESGGSGPLSYSADQLTPVWDSEFGRWTYEPGPLPSWLVFNPATRTFSGTVPSGAAAQTQVQVHVSDGTSTVSYNNFFFNVSSAARPADHAPTAGTLPNKHAIPNQAWNYALPPETFSDADFDPLTYSASGLPAGVTFNTATRTFSGTPTAGSYTISVVANDGLGGTLTRTFTLSVAANSAPTIVTAIPNQTLASGATWSYAVPAGTFTDSNGDALTVSAGNIPLGAVFNRATNTFSGTPAVGKYIITVTATDAFGASVSDSFVLTVGTPVNQPPIVAALIPAQTVMVGRLCNYAFPVGTFSDPDGNTLTYTATGLPPGVTFSAATRKFSGTPSTAGSWGVTVTASDGNGGTVKDIFNFTVTGNQPPVVAVAIPSQNASQNQAWSYAFPAGTFSDPNGDPLTYAATGMPAGVTFNAATRTFSGTPTVLGTSTITVTASDGYGGSVSASFAVTVTVAVNHAPTVATAIPNQSTGQNQTWSYAVPAGTFNDPDGDALALTATGMPSGVSFNTATNTFSGTPTALGTSTVTVTASDGRGGSVNTSFVLTVTVPVNRAPTVANPIPDLSVPGNAPMSYQFPANTFTDADGDPLTYTATKQAGGALPAWLSFDPLTRTFSGTPTLLGVNIKVTASDGHGGSVSDTFQLSVTFGGFAPMQTFAMTGNTSQSTTTTTTTTATTLRQQTAYYAYDAANRVSVVNGALVNGQVLVSSTIAGSSAVIYDAAGHQIGTESWGADLFTHQAGIVLQQSIVNARGQTTATLAPHLLSDAQAQVDTTQTFDADGRVLETRNYFAPNTFYSFPDGEGEPEAVDVSGMLESAQTYTYDADGRILSQTERQRPTGTTTRTNVNNQQVTFPTWILGVSNRDGTGSGLDQYNDLTVLSISSTVSYTGTNLGYDAAGRLKGYSYNVTGGSTQTFLSSYLGRDSWLESAVTASSTNTNERPTSSTIAYDAAGREISIRERTVYATIDDRWRFFSNDGEGHILRRRDGTEPQAGGTFTQGTTTADQQYANHHMVYANGQQVAALDEAGTIDALSHVTGFANTNIGSTNVVVQDGETLQSIAQRIYGNSGLWYVLAAANALDANTALVAGTTLKAPEVTTNKNDASTFKPYNPSDITGPTSPGLPYIHAPAAGCGTIGMIIMVVIAIIVTIYTAGAAAGAMGAAATSAAGTTAAVATSTAVAAGSTVVGATMGTGLAVLGGTYGIGAAVVAGAAGAFAGSIASQAVGSAMGVAHFSWQQVAMDTVVGGVTAGFGAWAEGGSTLGQVAANGGRELSTLGRVAQAVVGYGTSVATSKAVGRPTNFSWKAVAASAVGAYLSAEVGGQLPITQGGGSTGHFLQDFGRYFVNGAVNAEVRNAFGLGQPDWAQIGADAFGNALAGAIARSADAPRLTSPPSAAGPFGVANTFGPASAFGFGLFGFAGVNTDNAFSTNAFGFGAGPTASTGTATAAGAQTSAGTVAGNGAATPAVGGKTYAYPNYSLEELIADPSKVAEELGNSWRYYNGTPAVRENFDPPPSDIPGLHQWNDNVGTWAATPIQPVVDVQGSASSVFDADGKFSVAKYDAFVHQQNAADWQATKDLGRGMFEGTVNAVAQTIEFVASAPVLQPYYAYQSLVQGKVVQPHFPVPFSAPPTSASQAAGRFMGPIVLSAIPVADVAELVNLARAPEAVAGLSAARTGEELVVVNSEAAAVDATHLLQGMTPADVVEQANALGLKTPRDQLLLWSGFGEEGPAISRAYAEANGGVTLEMTPGGKWLEQMNLYAENSPFTESEADWIWGHVSDSLVEQASGQVRSVLGEVSPASIYLNREIPGLNLNPGVTGLSPLQLRAPHVTQLIWTH